MCPALVKLPSEGDRVEYPRPPSQWLQQYKSHITLAERARHILPLSEETEAELKAEAPTGE